MLRPGHLVACLEDTSRDKLAVSLVAGMGMNPRVGRDTRSVKRVRSGQWRAVTFLSRL